MYEILNDFNGDGLIDKAYLTIVASIPPTAYMNILFNTGTGFSYLGPNANVPFVDFGQTNSESANLSGTFGFPIPLISIKIGCTLKGSIVWDFTKEKMQLKDMNGDGYPDLIMSNEEGNLQVYYSKNW